MRLVGEPVGAKDSGLRPVVLDDGSDSRIAHDRSGIDPDGGGSANSDCLRLSFTIQDLCWSAKDKSWGKEAQDNSFVDQHVDSRAAERAIEASVEEEMSMRVNGSVLVVAADEHE